MLGMKTLFCACLVATAVLLSTLTTDAAGHTASDEVRVLVVTGGHKFDEQEFWQMFKDNDAITFEAVAHPNAHAHFGPDACKAYDVVVLYDMWQPITDEAKADFEALLKAGKGIVALHHCLASYQDWPAYEQIIGGKYVLKPKGDNAAKIRHSTFKHDIQLQIRVANRHHPVTQGVDEDFTILDEAYGGIVVANDVIPLLTAEHPESGPVVGWARTQEKSRIVCLQGGHDRHAFANSNFRRLLANAIQWTAGKD
jgi:type 1 glutamine amidotransferase